MAGQLGGGPAGRAARAAPRRTPRAGGPARRAAGRRTPPRRAARAGTRSGPRPATRRFISTAWRSPSSRAVGVEPGGRGEQLVGHPAAGHAGGAHDLAGGVVEPVEPHQQHVGEVVGHPAARGRQRRRPAPRRRTRCPRRGRRCPRPRRLAQRAPVRRRARRRACARRRRTAASAGSARRPRRRDHSATWRRRGWRRCRSSERYDATTATGPAKRTGEQEAQQVAGRLVGPVQVLDDQQQRRVARRGLEQRVHGLEQRRPGRCATARRPGPRSSPAGRAGAGRGRGGRSRRRRPGRAGRRPCRPRTSEKGR